MTTNGRTVGALDWRLGAPDLAVGRGVGGTVATARVGVLEGASTGSPVMGVAEVGGTVRSSLGVAVGVAVGGWTKGRVGGTVTTAVGSGVDPTVGAAVGAEEAVETEVGLEVRITRIVGECVSVGASPSTAVGAAFVGAAASGGIEVNVGAKVAGACVAKPTGG